MKQKVVIKVTMCRPKKSRTKAMEIAATCNGVEAVALKGDYKDVIEVIGEGIDTVELAKSLRKYVGHADFVSIGTFQEENKEEKKKEEKEDKNATTSTSTPIIYYNGYGYSCPPYCHYEPCNHEPSCSIM